MIKWLVGGAAVLAISVPLALLLLLGAAPTLDLTSTSLGGRPSALALADIPPSYLKLYLAAARTCDGLPWGVLAGIGKVESDHGRSDLPGVHSGSNFAGAQGPMQFEPATFAEFAIDADRSHKLSPYDPADAIYTAAAMLCADDAKQGTAAGIDRAVFAYNHSDTYVADVLGWASRYTVAAPSRIAATAIAFAMKQLGKPYEWGADGPSAFDCSGLVYAAYLTAGIQIARTTFGWQQDGPQVPLSELQPGDLLFSAGSDGTPANPGHVVMYLGGGQPGAAHERGRADRSARPDRSRGRHPARRASRQQLTRHRQHFRDIPKEGTNPMTPVTITQLRSSATVDLMTAARALGLGRTKAYELARRDQFPCRVIKIGDTYRIPTPGLLELLGVNPEQRSAPTPNANDRPGIQGRSPIAGRRPAGV